MLSRVSSCSACDCFLVCLPVPHVLAEPGTTASFATAYPLPPHSFKSHFNNKRQAWDPLHDSQQKQA